MIPRLDIQFPLRRQWLYWFGAQYVAAQGEYLVNHARTGIALALRAALPKGGRVGVVTYNCHTVANAVANAGCTPIFIDVTEDLHIDIASIPSDLDAIVVTNLFGIRNDISAIYKQCPHAIIIVDNAHGYGLPAEGDFTVYSINQGKFPALGEGGLLVESEEWRVKSGIDNMYASLPKYGFVAQCKLFCSMLIKAIAYSKLCYWLVRKLKKNANPNVHEKVVMRQMASGIRRLYKAWLPTADEAIAEQKRNADSIASHLSPLTFHRYIACDNGFMAIIRTDDVAALKADFAKRGIETETHFARAIDWATEFGYQPGTCPTAEKLVHQLLMIPTYTK